MDGGIGPMVLGWTLTQPLERLWYLDGTLECWLEKTKYPETRIPGEVAHLEWGPRRFPSASLFFKFGQIVIICDIGLY